MTTRTQIIEALKAARRWHYSCEDAWYSCPKSEGGCANEYVGTECSCGADKTNASIDAAIAELEKQPTEQVINNGALLQALDKYAKSLDFHAATVRGEGAYKRSISEIESAKDWFVTAEIMQKSATLLRDSAEALMGHPSTAKEVPADDYAAHYERKWHAVSAECADLQDQLNAANTKIVQMELASRQSPADVLAVLDELEAVENLLREAHQLGFRTAANWAQRDDMHSDVHSGAYCNDQAGDLHDIFTKVRTLTAKLRSMLGGEV